MDDLELVGRCRNNDRDAFRTLVERYQDRVFRLVASILGPHADLDAEEITQDVFLRVHRKLDQFRGESQFSSWLYRIAYNAALDRRRTARLKLTHVEIEVLHGLRSKSDPLHELKENQRNALVATAAEDLPDLYRTVLNQYYWMDCSIDEISAYIGAPAGTIKWRVSEARRLIRQRLDEHRRPRQSD